MDGNMLKDLPLAIGCLCLIAFGVGLLVAWLVL